MRYDMWKMIVIGFVLFTGLVLLNDALNPMAQCQKKHSYDTCFQAAAAAADFLYSFNR